MVAGTGHPSWLHADFPCAIKQLLRAAARTKVAVFSPLTDHVLISRSIGSKRPPSRLERSCGNPVKSRSASTISLAVNPIKSRSNRGQPRQSRQSRPVSKGVRGRVCEFLDDQPHKLSIRTCLWKRAPNDEIHRREKSDCSRAFFARAVDDCPVKESVCLPPQNCASTRTR